MVILFSHKAKLSLAKQEIIFSSKAVKIILFRHFLYLLHTKSELVLKNIRFRGGEFLLPQLLIIRGVCFGCPKLIRCYGKIYSNGQIQIMSVSGKKTSFNSYVCTKVFI